MFRYRKRSFTHAHAMLQTLRANREDLATLKEFQKLLLHEIIRAEEKIRELKFELNTINREANKLAERRWSYVENRIEGLRQCTYIWRSFGNAIAFLYMDKLSLKHCFYSTENTNPKQNAGFIAGKQGLGQELAIIEAALQHNVPALLVDLTNTIRHGDICLMGGSDPYLIESKSSKMLDRRGKKQKRSLEKLHTFYETDRGVGLRGFHELRRVECGTSERNYVNQINECIIEAQKNGYAVRQPERGLHYLVMTQDGQDPKQALGPLNLIAPVAFYLNAEKLSQTWAPYVPFVLSIEDKDHLWDFIRGNLFIFVFVEMDTLCQIALDEGCEANFDVDDEHYPIKIKIPGYYGGQISKHYLKRIGMEFASPEWIVLSAIEGLKRYSRIIGSEFGEAGST